MRMEKDKFLKRGRHGSLLQSTRAFRVGFSCSKHEKQQIRGDEVGQLQKQSSAMVLQWR